MLTNKAKNRLYWIDRLIAYNQNVIKDVEKLDKNLLNAYIEANDKVQKEIARIYTEYQDKDGAVSYTKLLKYQQLKKINAEMKDIAEGLAKSELKYMKTKFPDILKKTYGNVGTLLKAGFDTLNEEAIEYVVNYPWSGASYTDIVWDNKELLVKNLSKTITKGIIDGSSLTDMMLKLKALMDKEEWKCRRIVRTEAMHMVNAGNIERYKKAGVTELEYLATHDFYSNGKPRYCEVCIADNGRKFPLKEAPILPRHPNCRCTYIPLIESIVDAKEETKPKEEAKPKKEAKPKPIKYKKYNKTTLEDIKTKGMAWTTELTQEERECVIDYTGKHYIGINNGLRTGNEKYLSRYKFHVEEIEKAINKYEVTEPFVTYRGMDFEFMRILDEDLFKKLDSYDYDKEGKAKLISDKLLGNVLTDKGFSSTAVLTDSSFSRDIKIEIKVPAGKGKGAFVQPISNYGHENEFLLQKNSNLLVENVYFSKKMRRIVIEALLL